MRGTLVLGAGIVLFIVGIALSYVIFFAGGQPWGQLLGDNFLFARSLPFTIGAGIAIGFWRASGWHWGPDQRDQKIRRFAPSTVLLHALAGVALLTLIATGGWQYLKGLTAADSPIYMGTVYRVHYIAASLLIFVSVVFVTDWLLRGEKSLTIGSGQFIRTMRGLAHELPRPIGTLIGYGLGLDLRRAPPPTEQFTYYERAISFPLWELSIALIVVTGVIKAMRYAYPIVPGEVLYWVSAIHVGAGVLLGLKLLDHLRYVLAPSRWQLMIAMASGWIPAGYVQRFHAGWYARITSASAPATAASPSAAPPSKAASPAGGAS